MVTVESALKDLHKRVDVFVKKMPFDPVALQKDGARGSTFSLTRLLELAKNPHSTWIDDIIYYAPLIEKYLDSHQIEEEIQHFVLPPHQEDAKQLFRRFSIILKQMNN